MKSEQFITIQGWMRTDLNLTGNDLLVYAIIYGFSQDNESEFTGSVQYLADWCGASKQGIRKNLKNLLDKGYIIKTEYEKNGIKFCKYRYAPREVADNSVAPQTTQLPTPQQSCYNNIETNNIETNNIEDKDIIPINRNNTTDDQSTTEFEGHCYSPADMRESFLGSVKSNRKQKTQRKSLYSKCEDEVLLFTNNLALQDVLLDYLKFRLSVKEKPIYGVNQWKGMLNVLAGLAKDDRTKKDIVLQSTAKGWLSFYPLKEYKADVFSEGDGVSCESAEDTAEERQEKLRKQGRRTRF